MKKFITVIFLTCTAFSLNALTNEQSIQKERFKQAAEVAKRAREKAGIF